MRTRFLKEGLAFILLFAIAPSALVPQEVGLTVEVHLSDVGDRSGSGDSWMGTKGEGRRIEGFSVRKASPLQGLGLEYMCHIQDLGDSPWTGEGSYCGTRGQAKRLEGFSIRLTGPRKDEYELRYRCHVTEEGDSSWKSDGELCGTRGKGRAVEAIYISLKRL